jgi:hypothetical protein
MIAKLKDWLTFNGIRPESGGIVLGFKIGSLIGENRL